MAGRQSKWRFAVDRGGTFTDVIGCDPQGVFHTEKLFSASPDYDDSSIEGIRRILGIKGKNYGDTLLNSHTVPFRAGLIPRLAVFDYLLCYMMGMPRSNYTRNPCHRV